jgi:hypothetical protein
MYTGPDIITDGLVLALDAANTKSYPQTGTIWKDLSGNGNDGTLVNGVGYNSGNLGSLVFDGVDDHVLGPSPEIVGYPFTLSCWANASRSTRQTMLSIHRGTSDYFTIGTNNSKWSIEARRSNQEFTTSNIDVELNKWAFILAIFNSPTDRKLYVNSLLEGTDNASVGFQFQSPIDFFVGRQRFFTDGHGALFFEGLVSNANVYTRALSAQEIQQNFEALRGRYGI